MERKTLAFELKAIDETEGIFEGYASTWTRTPDAYGDVVDKGAFKKTIKENRGRIKVLWNHNVDEPIGIPVELREDDIGLYVKGKLSLGVQRAREVLTLMKDGVINTMSIGFRTITDATIEDVRHLKEVKLYDVSPVTFAANETAVIMSAKSVAPFADLPLAARDRAWDADAAEGRVRSWAGGDDIDWAKYRKAFLWYDAEAPDEFGSYKLQIADIIDGELTSVPRAIFAAAGVMQGARGGVDIPESDESGIKRHIARYYAKMAKEFDDDAIVPPWDKSEQAEEEIKATIEALQALLDRYGPQSTRSDDGAAELEGILQAINDDVSGFDRAEAERILSAAIGD
jgi:HK97 family phage prohead protease